MNDTPNLVPLPEPAAWQRLVNDPDDAPHFYWEECSKWEAENCAPKSDLRQLYTADQMHAHAAAVSAADNAALRVEVRELTTQAMFNASTIERLRAEVAGLREDAERYRYIRDDISIEHGVKMDGKRGLMAWWTGIGVASGSDEHIDAAIDAARKGSHADQA